MNTNSQVICVELARLPIEKMQDVLLARFIGRNEAAKLDFPAPILTRLATAISEITRNVVQHAGCSGEIHIARLDEDGRTGLRITVCDKGAGIGHPDQFLKPGSPCALGAGLPGARRLVDRFEIQSAPGAGTTVTMDLWKPKPAPQATGTA